MKTTFTSLVIAASLVTAMPLTAQIPNAGFENWTNGSPDSWLSNNITTIVTPIVQETPSHSGSYAVRGNVVQFAGSPYAPLLSSTDQMANGFPVSQTYSNFSFYYKMNITGTDAFEATIAFYDAGHNWVGGGGFMLTGAVSSYTLLNIPISYIGTNPTECVIIFGIHDTTGANPALTDFFVVDELSFSTASGVHEISAKPAPARTYPCPATDRVTLETGSAPELSEIFIYNVYGQTVKHFPTRNFSSNNSLTISIADLPAGIYPVSILSGNSQWQAKIVKQ